MLTRSGVRKLSLTDCNALEEENVSRDAATHGDLSRPKVPALADRLKSINPTWKSMQIHGGLI